MRESIQSLISKGAITVVAPHPQKFISTAFLVEKGQGTGEFRPVINLRALNRFLPKEKFKMEGLHTARSLLRSGDYMMKLELKGAYYAVPIHQDSRKYLRFQFEGTTFEFRCLPFGLSLAPWVFTRILRPVVAKLRSEGVRTVIYLDDLLLIHQKKKTLMEIFYYVQKLLSSLGFVVKCEKCSPAPTRQLIFLGVVLDTIQMSLALPGEQIDRIQTVCQQMLETGSTTLGELASLLGCMSHAARRGLWEAPLRYRALQRQQASLLHRVGWRPKTPISLNPPSLEDLAWWLSPTLHSHNRQDITPPPFDLTVRTDASLRGWGATCRGSTTGTLECGRTGAAHQLLGTQSGVSCVEIIPGSRGPGYNSLLGPAPSTSYSAGNGQHDSGCLCEQERGNAVPHTLSPSLGPVVFSSGKGLMDHSPSPTRRVECRSRCSLEGVQCAYRMDASEGCFQAHNASFLSSTDRPLCISPKPPGAPLRVPPPRSGGISSGRFSSGLEPMEEFHPSTSGTTASHSSESEGQQGYSLAGSP